MFWRHLIFEEKTKNVIKKDVTLKNHKSMESFVSVQIGCSAFLEFRSWEKSMSMSSNSFRKEQYHHIAKDFYEIFSTEVKL